MLYSGTADWDIIRCVKEALTIPVIANGDIISPQAATRCLARTGADGLMVGRGCFGDPWLFAQLRAALTEGQAAPLHFGVTRSIGEGLMPRLAPALLDALAAAGVKTAVVSNKPDATTKALAARFFPGLPAFGQRDDLPPKPAPDLVFRALETLGEDAADAVYVGDSEVDVATARNAGLPLAAVSWGFRGRQALAESGAADIVDTAEQLLAKLL